MQHMLYMENIYIEGMISLGSNKQLRQKASEKNKMTIEIVKQYQCDISDVAENEIKVIATSERFIERLEGAGLPTEWFKEGVVKHSDKTYDAERDGLLGHVKEHADCAQVYESHESQPEFSYGANLGRTLRATATDALREKDPWFDSNAWDIGKEVADVYFNSLGINAEQQSALKGMLYATEGFEQAFHPGVIRNESAQAAYAKKVEEWAVKKEQLKSE